WFFDREGRRALEEPDEFVADLDKLFADPAAYLRRHEETIRTLGDTLVPSWQDERRRIINALAATDPAMRVPWYGPSMSPMSFGTARLMETWAHGQDIADALGVERAPTDRLRHIAYLGVITRGFSYAVRGREAPVVPVYVALRAPSGAEWTWGDPSAENSVRGAALDFCLRVTQRRVLEDLDLEVTGDAAQEWMSIAQAFAGGPTLTDEARRGLP
ncbi:MAG TPA: TIGR03084 family metal-binding protein, partial [Mycobacteriales bacterium]|nr:TIGR03084 family metal-binding protein [Mycobacteriales bacterium]